MTDSTLQAYKQGKLKGEQKLQISVPNYTYLPTYSMEQSPS